MHAVRLISIFRISCIGSVEVLCTIEWSVNCGNNLQVCALIASQHDVIRSEFSRHKPAMTDRSTRVISDVKCRNSCCVLYCDIGCGAVKLGVRVSVFRTYVWGFFRVNGGNAGICLLLQLHMRLNWYIICRLEDRYFIWQLSLATYCRLVYCINLALAADRPHEQQSGSEDWHVAVFSKGTVYRDLFCKVICPCTSVRPVNVVLAAGVIMIMIVACRHSNCTGSVVVTVNPGSH
jgi:hypothetical protein